MWCGAGTTPSGLILVDAFRSLCSAEMRAAWLRTGTREAGVLSGRENQGPSLASTLPNRTNDSSPRVSTLCFRLLRAARRWLYLASLKQCKTSPGASVWTLQTGHDQDTMAAKSSKPSTVQELTQTNSSCYAVTLRWTCQEERTLKMLLPFSAGFWNKVQ